MSKKERKIYFLNWPLKYKMAILLLAASLLPLVISTWIDINNTSELQKKNVVDLLSARADELVEKLDNFNRVYARAVVKFSRIPVIEKYCKNGFPESGELRKEVLETLIAQHENDENVRGFAILDLTGKVRLSTEQPMNGKDLSFYKYVRNGLERGKYISDIHVATAEVDFTPSIAYLHAIFDEKGRRMGLAILWIRAISFWKIAKSSNGLAGPGSFAVLFNSDGIRIAHTYSEEIIFHPGGPLEEDVINQLIAESRYGENTKELLSDIRHFPEQFNRARSEKVDESLIHAIAPVNGVVNFGVTRRLMTVPWTLFFMIPEASIAKSIADMTRQRMTFAGVIILFALATGVLFAGTFLKPIKAISLATERFADGDLTTRVQLDHIDEVGRLGDAFNSMAEKIEVQSNSIRTAKDELEASNKELDAFTYSVSHDLRAPLRAIDGFSRILMEDFRDLPEGAIRSLERIRHNSQKMGRLVEDLLSFSRLGRHPLKKQLVRMDSLVTAVLDDFHTENADHRVKLQIETLDPCVGDPALLKQVWVNLISNALKYSKNKNPAIITIGMLSNPDKEPVYYIKDNGVGFDMTYVGKLFGVFQRLHTEEEFEGTGVGLAIVQRIIQKHGGKIWAESKVNEGATFYFSIGGENG